MRVNPRFIPKQGRFYLLLFLFLFLVGTASSAVVRGRLDRVVPGGGRGGAGGIRVTVSTPRRGRSPAVYSAQDGMYYIYNVPSGDYHLEIWVNGPNGAPMVYPVSVREPYTDIPAITVQ